MATTPLDYIPKINTGVNAGGLPPALLKQTAASLSGALRGELPEDVQNLLMQQAAEYGVASGMPGSQFQSYRGLRNLGLTSLDRIRGAEGILGNQFINPAQAQEINLRAGTTRAGLAQAGLELAQQKELEQEKLAQQGTLTREQLANQASIASAGEAGQNYRASLGLAASAANAAANRGGSHGGAGINISGGTGSGVAYTPGGTGPVGGISYGSPSAGFDWAGYYNATGLSPGAGTTYGSNGVPTYDNSYDDSGFTNYDDVIDYYGY